MGGLEPGHLGAGPVFAQPVGPQQCFSDRSCWANRRAYSAAAGGTLVSSREIPSMSMSSTALRFELVLATISRCTAWSWRESGVVLVDIAGIYRVQARN